jgi:hypothetical protein
MIKHIDRFCRALGFIVVLMALVVVICAALGVELTWPCTYHTYASFEHVQREGLCKIM